MSYKAQLLSGELKPAKCEILFTRKCPILCDYCGITTKTVGARPDLSILDWMRGVEQLKQIGIEIAVIYGGEPTVRLGDLAALLRKLTSERIYHTVITACIGMTPTRWDILLKAGLDSVTVSLDHPPGAFIEPEGQTARTKWVLDSLNYLRGKVRDIEVVFTMDRQNYDLLPRMLDWTEANGYWLYFDPYHPNRGQPGSKCLGTEFAFQWQDIPALSVVIDEILRRKLDGARVHNATDVLERWRKGEVITDYGWRCKDPFFLCVDCDGSIQICDDSSPEDIRRFSVLDVGTRWAEFVEAWYAWRGCSDCHCSWASLMQAQEESTKIGRQTIVHGRKTFQGTVP